MRFPFNTKAHFLIENCFQRASWIKFNACTPSESAIAPKLLQRCICNRPLPEKSGYMKEKISYLNMYMAQEKHFLVYEIVPAPNHPPQPLVTPET